MSVDAARTQLRAFRLSRATLVVLVGAAVLSIVGVLTLVDPHHQMIGFFAGSADLHVYRDGGWRVRYDIPLYDSYTVYGHLYTYTPFSAIVFVPVMLISARMVDQVWMAFNVGVLFGCILLCWRMLGYRIGRDVVLVSALLTFAAIFLEPVRTTLFYGQINLVLLALVLWDFSRPESSRIRGIGVGVAAGIKLTPLYFVAYSLALRQWRTAATAVVTFFGTIAFAWAVIPADSRKYWTEKIFDPDRIGFDSHPANQSLRGVVAHLTGSDMPGWLWVLAGGTIALVNLVVAVLLHRAGDRLLALVSCGLGAAVVSPFSWSHHWVWFVPLLVYIVHRASTSPRWWLTAAALYAVAGSWVYYYANDYRVVGLFMFPPWWSWPIKQLLFNIYVLAFVVIEVWLVVRLRRR